MYKRVIQYLQIAFLFSFLLNISSIKAETVDSLENKTSEQVMMSLLRDEGISVTDDNKIELLKSGEDKFLDLFEEIRNAKQSIHLEYFNFRNDSIANALFDLLGKKVKEGVEVRAIFDAFGNMSNNRPLKKKHLKAIREKGIEIVKFDPIKFPWINHVFKRDHRKIVVIDGKIGYTGGMNIADYYIKGLPKIGAWRDMHIKIEGSAVNYLQDIFLEIWNKTTKQNIGGENYYQQQSNESTDNESSVAIIDRIPGKTPDIMRKLYVNSINAAKEKIQIINPYFVPTHSIKKALKKALKRGVDIEIMIPGKSDIPFTPDAAFYTAHKLQKKGAHIYIFNGGFHHSKIMMIDSTFCTVGSTNLNSRSLRYDYEVNALIFDKKITNELIDLFNADKKKSVLMDREWYKNRSGWKRFVGWFANMLTPVL